MAEGEGIADAAKGLWDKKFIGLPFPVILIGVAGTAYVIRKLKTKQSAAQTAASGENGYVVDSSGNKFASAYTGAGGGVTPFGTGSITDAISSGANAVTPATEVNNEGWLRRATEKLQGLGQWNVTDIQTALATYISGGDLNQRQTAIVDQASKVEGLPPINVTPGKNTTSSTSVIRYLNPAGNAGIFAQYDDGSVRWIQDAQQWDAIKANNPNVDTKVQTVAVSDPVWRNADVVQSKNKQYLVSEATYKQPGDKYSNYTILDSWADAPY